MSRKFYDKLLQSNGVSTKKFECDYGMALLKKMGWSEDQGLGKNKNGITECIQIKRREEGLGLGGETKQKEFRWNNNFWEKQFNDTIKTLHIENSSTSSAGEESEVETKKKVVKKNTKKEVVKKKAKESSAEESSSSGEEDLEEYIELRKTSKKIRKEIKDTGKPSEHVSKKSAPVVKASKK